MGDPNEGKSTTGIIARMHGIPILTKSSIQRMNAKSSTNAEIIALCDAVEEAVYIKNLTEEKINNVEPENKVETIHKRLGHISPENMKQLRKNGWIDFSDADMKRFESSPCDGCLKATYNQKHSGHKRRDAKTRNPRRSTEKGHWHCDLMILTGNSKFKRALIMVEERSRFTHISFTTEAFNEEEAEYLFEELKETIEANGNEIKSLRWDGESAIWDTAFKKWCNERQIRLDRSASGEQNLAESKIATL